MISFEAKCVSDRICSREYNEGEFEKQCKQLAVRVEYGTEFPWRTRYSFHRARNSRQYFFDDGSSIWMNDFGAYNLRFYLLKRLIGEVFFFLLFVGVIYLCLFIDGKI